MCVCIYIHTHTYTHVCGCMPTYADIKTGLNSHTDIKKVTGIEQQDSHFYVLLIWRNNLDPKPYTLHGLAVSLQTHQTHA